MKVCAGCGLEERGLEIVKSCCVTITNPSCDGDPFTGYDCLSHEIYLCCKCYEYVFRDVHKAMKNLDTRVGARRDSTIQAYKNLAAELEGVGK